MHTPGPWEVYAQFNIRSVAGGRGVATSGGPQDGRVEDGGFSENCANAHMAAAAPELFTFANHPVIDWLLGEGIGCIPEPQRTSARLFLIPARDAALAKATGAP